MPRDPRDWDQNGASEENIGDEHLETEDLEADESAQIRRMNAQSNKEIGIQSVLLDDELVIIE